MSGSDTAPTWPRGYRITGLVEGPSAELVDAFSKVPVAVAGDCMGRSIGAIGPTPYYGHIQLSLCHPAFTVRVRPGDNLMIQKVLTTPNASAPFCAGRVYRFDAAAPAPDQR